MMYSRFSSTDLNLVRRVPFLFTVRGSSTGMQCRMYLVGYYLVYIRSIEENVTVNVVSANDFKTVNCELNE